MDKGTQTVWIGSPNGDGTGARDDGVRGTGDAAAAATSSGADGVAAQAMSSGAGDVAEAAVPEGSASRDSGSSQGAGTGQADAPAVLGEQAPAQDLDTPAALLAAGKKLFSRYGYAGASVRAITSEAGANLGAITYHFGSKKTLYNRVVEACVSPLATRVEAALSRPLPVLDRLELVVGAYFEHFGENPELPSLMLQELVAGGGPPEAAGPTMRRIYGLILGAIREGQAVGQIREGDPVLLGLSLISQPVFPMVVRVPVQMLTGLDMRDAATRERVAQHVAKTVRAALERRREEGQ